MRFFTPELFVALNSHNDRVADQAEENWEAAREGYWKHLDKIEGKLPGSLAKFGRTIALHDGRIGHQPNPVWTIYETDDAGERNWATISVEHELAEFTLIYLDPVAPTQVTRPVRSDVFRNENVLWLYDEVGWVEDGVYSHEILLSNGDVVLVKFKGFKYAERPIFAHRFRGGIEAAAQPGP